jgi:hypothetical protein
MDNCSICREELNNSQQEFTLDCNHRFHTKCIVNSFRITNMCPICRSTAGYRETRPVDIEEQDNISFSDIYSDNLNASKFIHEIVNSYDELTELKKNIISEFNEYKINNNLIRKKVKELDNQCFKSYLDNRAELMLSIYKLDEVSKYKIHHNNYTKLKSELNKLLTKKLKEYGYEMSKYDINKIYNKYLKSYLKCKTHDSSIISYHYEVVDLEYLITKAKSEISSKEIIK